MHHFLPTDLAATIDDISAPRLSSYRNFFLPESEQELYGIYCWNDAMSIRFMRLIGIIEVIMRNRFHRELSRHAYKHGSSHGVKDSNNWYRYLVQPGSKTAEHLQKKCGTLNSSVPAHKVVAGMTFGFWNKLLSISQAPGGARLPWKSLIPNIFEGHPQRTVGHWKKEHHRDQLYSRIDFINDFRNRIAHFEPLWKFGGLKDEWLQRPLRPVNVVDPAPTDIATALRRLKLTHDRALQLLSWLSIPRAADYRRSENFAALEWLFSQSGFDHYKNIGTVKPVRLGSFTKSWGAKLVIKNGTARVITDRAQIIGMYIPVLGAP